MCSPVKQEPACLPPKKDKRKIEIFHLEKNRKDKEKEKEELLKIKIEDDTDTKSCKRKRGEKEKSSLISLTCGDCGRYMPIGIKNSWN
jgi:hypothetical protein